IAKVIPLSFLSLKISSTLGGVLLIITAFYFTLELLKDTRMAYFVSFLSAISFWSLSFSRQAKPHIFVAFFALSALLFSLRKKDGLAGFFIGLGMYTQASFFGVPLLFLLLRKIKSLLIAAMISLPLVFSFLLTKEDPMNASFFIEKLTVHSGGSSTLYVIQRILDNILRNIGSFFWVGDKGFRHTISGLPHLDVISGFFLLAGLAFTIKESITRKRSSIVAYFLLPFFVLQLPSILDIANRLSTPNMGRMIAVMPFAYIGSTYGFIKLWRIFQKKPMMKIVLLDLWILAVVLNLYLFFFVYPQQLPNRNIAFGETIAEKIDSYDKNYEIIVNGCCWGQWGQPEPNGIRFRLENKRDVHFFAADQTRDEISCELLQSQFRNKKVAVFVDPTERELLREVQSCLANGSFYTVRKSGLEIVRVIEGKVYSPL
ncbi:hypothetical protein HYW87_01205, partial [Candidatus Roizmanbacteria bacterium]|nr:hypothetical protein [Candidatus Roizmanbacteria bacterium]